MCRMILIIFFLFSYLNSFQQNNKEINCSDILKIDDEKINHINMEMDELIKCNEYLFQKGELSKLYLFWLDYMYRDESGKIIEEEYVITKKNLIDYSFFHNLWPIYHNSITSYPNSIKRKKNSQISIRVLSSYCFIYDSQNNCVGMTQSDRGYLFTNFTESTAEKYSDLYKLILSKNINCIFRVNPIAHTYFGVKDGNIFCIYYGNYSNEGFVIYPLEDFVQIFWDTPVFDMLKYLYVK